MTDYEIKVSVLVLHTSKVKGMRLYPNEYIPNADGYLSFEAFAEVKRLLDRLKEYEAKESKDATASKE